MRSCASRPSKYCPPANHSKQTEVIMTDNKLKSIVDRIERLEEEQKALLETKRGIYLEAKKAELNPNALPSIIAERPIPDRNQFEADMRHYRIAPGMAVNDVANGASLRDAAAKHSIPKSTIHDAVRREKKTEIGQPPEPPPQIAAET